MAAVADRVTVPGRHRRSSDAAWLVSDGRVLASAEVAATRARRRRGLLGRDRLDGVLVIPTRAVHTVGMRFVIDVAYCDAHGRVVRTTTLPPGRVPAPGWSARWVVEAPAGALASWGVQVGSVLQVRS
jgi:uncharacterized membrane protein (UPF0127 family)